ncbi:DUF4232 domain-containing protein [Streptomyces sp. NPDC048106]|uniref:DUF4232 domain-containing protein n=1 Tax=Streptomyces sp. NPDC048106 TaxID=3155750 RepID=UPI0034531B4C
MRDSRIRRTRTPLLAAAGAALAALALTACDSGTGTKDEGVARHTPSASTSTGTHTGNDTKGTDKPAADAKEQGGSAGSGGGGDQQASTGAHSAGGTGSAHGSSGSKGSGSKGSGSTDSATRALCNGANTRVTAQVLSRPLNHMLLTVTNTGSKNCDLTYYPVLRFDGMQWAPGADESTQPQAVTTLAPGESGYAGVLLSAADGSGDGGTTSHQLTVYFQGMTPRSDGGATASPALPAKGVYYDSTLKVTYWQRDASDIASW